MLDQNIVIIIALGVYVVVQEVRSILADRRHERQVERMARLVKADSLGEFTANEALLTRPAKRQVQAKQGPKLYDDMLGTTPHQGE